LPLTPVRLLRTFRYALDFDGVDDRVVVPHSDYLNVQSGNRITIIMRLTPLGWQSGYPVGVVLDKRTEQTANYNWEFSATVMEVRIHANNAIYGVGIPHSLGETNEYAMVLDGNILKGYKNGLLVSSRADVAPSTGNLQNLRIGEAIVGGFSARMVLHHVLIYSRPLSDDEIRWNYENPEDPVSDGLRLSLYAHPDNVRDIDNDGINEWLDLSGNGNHGKIYGAALREVVRSSVRVLAPARVMPPAR